MFWLMLLVILGLGVLLWAGTLTVQGYLYTEPAPALYWRAPAAAGALGLYLIFWCVLAYSDPDAGLDTFLFNTREDKTFNEFWARRQLQGSGKFVGPEIHFRKQGDGPFRDDQGRPWQRNDSQGIMGAVFIHVDGTRLEFHPDLTEKRTFKIEPGESLRYREVDGDLTLTEDQLLQGVLPVYHTGRFWANVLLNLLHLSVWFVCLWLLLRFQWPHALGLALLLWLAASVPGSLVPTLLARANDAGREDMPSKTRASSRAGSQAALTVVRHPHTVRLPGFGERHCPWRAVLAEGSRPMNPTLGVPLCDLQGQYRALQPQIDDALARVLRSGQVILGPEVEALEHEVAQYCGAGYAVGCGSGTDALLLALHALGVGPGDEVILPPFTFFATAGAVCRAGARPVFADIDAATFNLDPLQVENKITGRTRAILAVHLFGQCMDMEALWHIAERHNLPVIEDAAQAIGADYQGKRTGTLGAIGCFSFYPSKNLGAYGDAGMTVTNDPEWAARMACLRVHGMEPKYFHKYLGWNARLDALQAAVLRVKLPYLDHWIEARQEAAARYDALIDEYHLGRFLARPVVCPHRRHVFNQYVVRVAEGQRDGLVRYLKADKIGCEIYYPVPLHRQECLAYLGHGEGDFPASEEACRTVLALPMFPELTLDQQHRVVNSCSMFLRQQARMAA